MQLTPSEISELIKKRIKDFDNSIQSCTEGTIVSISDGIVRISGLSQAKSGEMIQLPNSTYGLVLNLEVDSVGIAVLGDYEHLREGQKAYCTGHILQVPVGNDLLGRVVDSLGSPLDGKGKIRCKEYSPIEKVAPGVIFRKSVSEPLHTGIKAIDSMVPIGRGQRELIIGDRKTGKTSLAIDTIINQKNTGTICIYVAIGQKNSSVSDIVQKLDKYGALSYTIVVSASAADSACLQYLAPYSGCSMGEYFRDKGENALIIYDDLTKQAWAYRQISLLLRRPPGREAYPGDIFYLHSRLLERASCINSQYIEKIHKGKIKNKTGSLTAIPIIETQSGDISSFVPTNVISITDGQIFLETDLFNLGIRPAINPGNSVSRVGGAAQTHIIKKLGSSIRLSLAQYRELEAFSQFSSDLDDITKKKIQRGQRVVELMKQKQFSTLSVAKIAISLYVVQEGFLDDIDLNKISSFEKSLHKFFEKNYLSFMESVNRDCVYNQEVSQKFKTIVTEFKSIN